MHKNSLFYSPTAPVGLPFSQFLPVFSCISPLRGVQCVVHENFGGVGMSFSMDQYRESADFLGSRLCGFQPEVLMIKS